MKINNNILSIVNFFKEFNPSKGISYSKVWLEFMLKLTADQKSDLHLFLKFLSANAKIRFGKKIYQDKANQLPFKFFEVTSPAGNVKLLKVVDFPGLSELEFEMFVSEIDLSLDELNQQAEIIQAEIKKNDRTKEVSVSEPMVLPASNSPEESTNP